MASENGRSEPRRLGPSGLALACTAFCLSACGGRAAEDARPLPAQRPQQRGAAKRLDEAPPTAERALTPELEARLAGSRSGREAVRVADEYGMTVDQVAVTTDGSDLVVTVRVDEDVEQFLEQHRRASALVKLYLDLDNDPATGGRAWSNALASGFEVEVEVRPGAIFRRDDGEVEVGVGAYPSDASVVGAIVVADVSRHLEGAPGPERVAGGLVVGGLSDEIRTRSRVEGRELTLTIPYKRLGLQPYSAVRVTARRLAVAGGLADQYFPEALLSVN